MSKKEETTAKKSAEVVAETAVQTPTAINRTEMNIYQKIAQITGEIGAIAKGGTNRDQGYAFIEYAAVAGELRGLFAKYGVVITPDMQKAAEQKREEITTRNGGKGVAALIDFTFNIINADKPDDRFTVNWVGEATDYGDKATNKAATAALKYYLMRQFNVSEKGEADADRETIERAGNQAPVQTHRQAAPAPASEPAKPIGITDMQKQNLSKALAEKGITGEYQKVFILKIAKVEDISKISVQNARVIIDKVRAASAEELQSFLADMPITPSTDDDKSDEDHTPNEPADATDADAPALDAPEDTEAIEAQAAKEVTVDQKFKDGVKASLDALNLPAVDRMRLLKDSTGAISPNNLTDDQWRRFGAYVDQYAIEMADKITEGETKQVKTKGGVNVDDQPQA